jgi:hypothetical protein
MDTTNIRLEFDEGQLHTTFHDRNDGTAVFERWMDSDASGTDVALCDEYGAEIARRFNEHDSLVAQRDALAAALRVIAGAKPTDDGYDVYDAVERYQGVARAALAGVVRS